MKTTSKTFFSLMTVGLVLTAVSQSKSLAQSDPAAEKPMPEHVLKILCQRFPLNSRCQGSGDSSATTPSTSDPTSTTPSSSGSSAPTPSEPKSETPAMDKSGSMTPATAPAEATGGGTMAPSGTTETPKSEGTSTTDMPKTADPTKTEGESKPVEPSSETPGETKTTK